MEIIVMEQSRNLSTQFAFIKTTTINGQPQTVSFELSEYLNKYATEAALRSKTFLDDHLTHVISNVIQIQKNEEIGSQCSSQKTGIEYWNLRAPSGSELITIIENIKENCEYDYNKDYLYHLLKYKQNAIFMVAVNMDIYSSDEEQGMVCHQEECCHLHDEQKKTKGKEKLCEHKKCDPQKKKDDIGAFAVFIPRYLDGVVSLEINCSFSSYPRHEILRIINSVTLEMCRISGIRYAIADPPKGERNETICDFPEYSALGFKMTKKKLLSDMKNEKDKKLTDEEINEIKDTPFLLFFENPRTLGKPKEKETEITEFVYLDMWRDIDLYKKYIPMQYKMKVFGELWDNSEMQYPGKWVHGFITSALCYLIPTHHLMEIYFHFMKVIGQLLINGKYIRDSRFSLEQIDNSFDSEEQFVEEFKDEDIENTVYNQVNMYKLEKLFHIKVVDHIKHQQTTHWNTDIRMNVLKYSLCRSLVESAMTFYESREFVKSTVLMLEHLNSFAVFGKNSFDYNEKQLIHELWKNFNDELQIKYEHNFLDLRFDNKEVIIEYIIHALREIPLFYISGLYTFMADANEPLLKFLNIYENIDYSFFMNIIALRLYSLEMKISDYENHTTSEITNYLIQNNLIQHECVPETQQETESEEMEETVSEGTEEEEEEEMEDIGNSKNVFARAKKFVGSTKKRESTSEYKFNLILRE